MPLSEHEQRMLEQIERALYAEDPKFANTVRQTNPQVHYKRRIIKASIGFVLGIFLLLGGLITASEQPWTVGVSIVGFIVMLASVLWGLSGLRGAAGGTSGAEGEQAAQPKQRRQQRPGMMNRFEERWRRRQEGE
ncbi:DUF3040 domain-containing protein [Nocardiopsis ansamitocini]|uniref:DUF3040 domain-containing protein n=1 Tax=Nocardiopsis ansamitocini TaxID=1670832 RepID=UPI0025527FC2|nr:DUF3040 domain-containing protein [Nocardiopsis ansamitocini]